VVGRLVVEDPDVEDPDVEDPDVEGAGDGDGCSAAFAGESSKRDISTFSRMPIASAVMMAAE